MTTVPECDECPWKARAIDIDRLNVILRGLVKRFITTDGQFWIRHPCRDSYYCWVEISHQSIVGLSRSRLVEEIFTRLRESIADMIIEKIRKEALQFIPRNLP